ncbi:MAG: hypothetical protein PHV77_01810 [Candidatus Omnitrophica bacterium]|nr:hypothetical protein [Candidatus Omnitrophota bacterium]
MTRLAPLALLTVYLFFSFQNIIMAQETDPGIYMPEQAAKEYVSRKYGCDIDELVITDVMIGRRSARVDVSYGYTKERVALKYNESESRWEAEGSSSPSDGF